MNYLGRSVPLRNIVIHTRHNSVLFIAGCEVALSPTREWEWAAREWERGLPKQPRGPGQPAVDRALTAPPRRRRYWAGPGISAQIGSYRAETGLSDAAARSVRLSYVISNVGICHMTRPV